MNIYFGDIHNHCNISYGYGDPGIALREAKEHLDFCSITGHAHWPDIYKRNEDTGFIIDFHQEGFEKLEKNWAQTRKIIAEANTEGEFITFQSFEMHSSKYGDHHFISPDDTLAIEKGENPGEVVERLGTRAIAIPHHIAYSPGYRGISWKDFNENISPVVEVYSKHGCGMSDESSGEYLHTMGPRDGRNTAFTGLAHGKRFGFVGSTDHHAGYPGSYGDGLTAVLAENLTRESIWEAILARRTYALTGDRIRCKFMVNDSHMGSFLTPSGKAHVYLESEAASFVDRAIIYKNLKPIFAKYREDFHDAGTAGEYKIRIEVGWGRKNTPYSWENSISVKDGKILSVDKCFRGRSVLAPREGESHPDDVNLMGHRVETTDRSHVNWKCTTFRNTTTRHSSTNAVILSVEGSPLTSLYININGKKINIFIRDILDNSISGHLQEYNSEAFLIHRAVPAAYYRFKMEGDTAVKPGDFIHAEIHQTNGQSAWISPVFFERK